MQVLVDGNLVGSTRKHLTSAASEHLHCAEMAADCITAPDRDNSRDVDQEHVFLYKLVPGIVASSYGVSASCVYSLSFRACSQLAMYLKYACDVIPCRRYACSASRHKDALLCPLAFVMLW